MGRSRERAKLCARMHDDRLFPNVLNKKKKYIGPLLASFLIILSWQIQRDVPVVTVLGAVGRRLLHAIHPG